MDGFLCPDPEAALRNGDFESFVDELADYDVFSLSYEPLGPLEMDCMYYYNADYDFKENQMPIEVRKAEAACEKCAIQVAAQGIVVCKLDSCGWCNGRSSPRRERLSSTNVYVGNSGYKCSNCC